jgi:DNA polymerase-4/DNA polymerase V
MICHIDADSFFASVLVRQNPSLKGKELLALGMGGGCVIAASYEAKAKGVKTGMTLKDALKLAPHAARIPSDFQETGLASHQIESVLSDICPRMDQFSIDEWFLDLTTVQGGLPKDLGTFASNLRTQILDRVGLSVSVGIGPSKTLAKMASEYRKPGGVTVVFAANNYKHTHPPPPAGEGLGVREFLLDRPAAAICGIGPARMAHCQSKGWTTAWDIAQASPEKLCKLFGKPGKELGEELRGIRVYDIVTNPKPPQSVSRARSFARTKNGRLLWAHVLRHLEYTLLKMRRHKLACRGVSVWLRDGEYKYRSSHCSLPRPLNTEEAVQPFVRRCFSELYRPQEFFTQAGLAIWNLCPGGVRQFSLFEAPEKALAGERLQDSLDELHERFGRSAITRGSALAAKTGTKRSFEVPVY